MLADLASAIIGIAIALIIAFPLGENLRKFPVLFYFVAILVVALHFIYRVTGAYIASAQVFLDVLNRAYLGVALLGIVMFIGVFDENASLRKKLQPIRAELSILSFIFICDHMIGYAPSYIPVLGRLASLRLGMALSIVCAIVLALIFAVLAATSLRAVRTKMLPATWKKIQRSAYVMVGLLWFHIVLVLSRSAVSETGGQPSAQVALVVYTVLIVLYAVLRIRKAMRDKQSKQVSSLY